MKSNIINTKICYETAGLPPSEHINFIYSNLYNKIIPFIDLYNNINNIIKTNGYSLDIILKEITLKILKENGLKNKAQLLSDLADLENKLTKSVFNDIYISTLISIFHINN